MLKSRKVRDVMIDILEFPHIPYWYTIKQSIAMLKHTSTGSKILHPQVLLVFEEKYNLVGIMGIKEILRGLEPGYLSAAKHAQVIEEDESSLALLWDNMFDKKNAGRANKQVSDFMCPINYFVDADDPLTKPAYLMVHHNLDVLPVIENKKKLIAIVRLSDIFDELSAAIL